VQLGNLVKVGKIKALAEQLRIARVEGGRTKLVLQFAEETEVNPQDLVELVQKGDSYTLRPDGVLEATLPSGTDAAEEALALLGRLA
jgi:transcription-repair coupling factor (superfamily II helicase)